MTRQHPSPEYDGQIIHERTLWRDGAARENATVLRSFNPSARQSFGGSETSNGIFAPRKYEALGVPESRNVIGF